MRRTDDFRQQEHGTFLRESGESPPTSRQGAAVRRFFGYSYARAIRSRLDAVKKVARKVVGFRNTQNHTTAVNLHCGGLDLYPR